MELCKLDITPDGVYETTRERVEVNPHTYLEKNWMPILDMPFHYVRWCNPLEIIKINPENKAKQKVQEGKIDIISSEVVFKSKQKLNLPLGIRGGSQVIPFGDDGDRICVTHDTHFYHHQNLKKDAHYYHRFIIWDKNWKVKRISEQFKFMDTMIEFSCGLIIKDNNLIITYGYQDNAAYALKMPLNLLDELKWDMMSNLQTHLHNYINEPLNSHFNAELGETYEQLGQGAAALSYFLRAAELLINVDIELSYNCLLKTWETSKYNWKKKTMGKSTIRISYYTLIY